MFEGQHWHGSKNNGYIHASDMAFESARKFLNDKRPKDKPFALTVALYPPKAVGVSSVPGAQFRPKNSTRALYDNITYQRPYDVDKAFASLPDFLRRPRGIWRGRYVERWNSSEQFQESMRNYHALITENDIACAGITSIIKNQGLWNKTMIIFTSDNGLLTGAHGLAGKWNPFEESIRVPLIIYDPRMPMEKRGTTDDSFTLNIDLAETILGAAKISPPKIMQGRDIADLYLRPNTTTPWRDEFYYEFPEGIGLTPSEALVRKKYKYIKYPNAGVEFEQFFDLENDPYELNDLLHSSDLNASSSVKGVLEEMRQRFIILRDQLTEPNKTIPPDSCLDIEGWKKNKTYPVVG